MDRPARSFGSAQAGETCAVSPGEVRRQIGQALYAAQPGVINLDALHLVTSFLTQLSTRYMVIPLISFG